MTTGSWVLLLSTSAAVLVVYPAPLHLALPASTERAPRRPLSPGWRRALVVTAGVFGLVLMVGRWPWWLGLILATVSGALARSLPSRRSNAELAADRHRLAVHADLVAACLDAGMSVGSALLAVPTSQGRLSPGRDSGRLLQGRGAAGQDPIELLDGVAALLMLGADPESAWRSAQTHPDLAPLAAAASRSAAGGTAFAEAVREHAVHLRRARADAAARSAGRAGVAMTAPLGLCFLPAFLCLGLAPVVVGLLSTLNLF